LLLFLYSRAVIFNLISFSVSEGNGSYFIFAVNSPNCLPFLQQYLINSIGRHFRGTSRINLLTARCPPPKPTPLLPEHPLPFHTMVALTENQCCKRRQRGLGHFLHQWPCWSSTHLLHHAVPHHCCKQSTAGRAGSWATPAPAFTPH